MIGFNKTRKIMSILLVFSMLLLTSCGQTKGSGSSDQSSVEENSETLSSTDSTVISGTDSTDSTKSISGSSSKTSSTAEIGLNKKANVRIWFSPLAIENDALRKIAANFTKETGVKVTVLDSNIMTVKDRLPTSAKASDKPDIVYMQSSDLGYLVQSNFLNPIEIINDDLRSRYDAAAFDGYKYNGKPYGIALTSETIGIIYNKNIVTTLPKTWAEFFTMAEALTQRDGSKVTRYGALLNPDNYFSMYSIITNYGGYYFGKSANGSYNAKDIGIDNAGSVAAFTKLLDMKNKGLTISSYTETDATVLSKFLAGNAGMIINGLWDVKNVSFPYGFAPFPNHDDGSAPEPPATAKGLVVNKYTTNLNEVNAFLLYLLRDANQQLLFEAANGGDKKTGAMSTCNKSVIASQYVQSNEILKSLILVNRTGVVFPTNPETPIIWNYSKSAMDAIIFKSAPIQAKLTELANKIKSDIAKMQG